MNRITRRSLLASGIAAASAGLVVSSRRAGLIPPDWRGPYGAGETLSYAAHRLVGRDALAREFPREMISARPFANTIYPPLDESFERQHAEHLENWRLQVEGEVDRAASFSLGELRAMERRSQITEVACEEGWSYIAEWAGTPLATVLNAVGVRSTARYVVYFSPDPAWWESIDIDEAMHPQTLLAWEMNGVDLPVPFGGPLRMRVPRQLGYKSVKFVNRIVVADSVAGFGDGTGQSDANKGYAWYAGI